MTTNHTYPIIDGHNDTLLALTYPEKDKDRSFFDHSPIGHLDLPRANAANLKAALFAIFVPSPKNDLDIKAAQNKNPNEQPPTPALDPNRAIEYTDNMIDTLNKLIAESNGILSLATDYPTLESNLNTDTLSAILHFEDAAPILPDLSNLQAYYDKGLRSIGLTWSRPNAFATGVRFKYPGSPDFGPGLTPEGKNLIKAANNLGIMIDLSHINEKGFYDVANLSTAPLVATHSCVHAISPCSRNLTDDQLKTIADSNGLVGLNFCNAFLRPDGKSNPDTPLSLLIDHIKYIADKFSPDHIALGSDFDGADVPDTLKDAAGLPKLIEELQKSGFSHTEIEKITHKNWLRILKTTWKS